jgi:DNA-binding NarL/FixJ family response regulator
MNLDPSRRMTVLVMHSDPLLCAGLVAVLCQKSNLQVVVDGPDRTAPGGIPIDVIVADYDGAMQLVDTDVRRRCGALADARILTLTGNDRETDVRRAIEAGVHGYLLLDCSLNELVESVRTVGQGVRYLCLAVARRMADSVAGEALTMRENEVLRLVATGQPNKAIARELGIGLGTVKAHVSTIMTKLGAKSRTQATSVAVARGLVVERRSSQFASLASRTRTLPEWRFHPGSAAH